MVSPEYLLMRSRYWAGSLASGATNNPCGMHAFHRDGPFGIHHAGLSGVRKKRSDFPAFSRSILFHAMRSENAGRVAMDPPAIASISISVIADLLWQGGCSDRDFIRSLPKAELHIHLEGPYRRIRFMKSIPLSP